MDQSQHSQIDTDLVNDSQRQLAPENHLCAALPSITEFTACPHVNHMSQSYYRALDIKRVSAPLTR